MAFIYGQSLPLTLDLSKETNDERFAALNQARMVNTLEAWQDFRFKWGFHQQSGFLGWVYFCKDYIDELKHPE